MAGNKLKRLMTFKHSPEPGDETINFSMTPYMIEGYKAQEEAWQKRQGNVNDGVNELKDLVRGLLAMEPVSLDEAQATFPTKSAKYHHDESDHFAGIYAEVATLFEHMWDGVDQNSVPPPQNSNRLER